MTSVEQRVATCEAMLTRQRKIIRSQWVGFPAALLLVAAGAAFAEKTTTKQSGSLVVKKIAIVDKAGVVRARLAGDLPPGHNASGHIFKRPMTAGLVIYDEQGIERGGYVTQAPESNALLTLDSKDHQAAWFIAGPSADQVSSLKLWRPGSSIELRADESGSHLRVGDTSGLIVHQFPESSK